MSFEWRDLVYERERGGGGLVVIRNCGSTIVVIEILEMGFVLFLLLYFFYINEMWIF